MHYPTARAFTQELAQDRKANDKRSLSPASIASRLASLSSLFKHLTDRQLTLSNPVAGVRRPKTGNAGMGAGKSPTLSKRQVRSMLDAPDTTKLQGLRDRSLLHIYFYAGARCSEPTLPRVKDVGYDNEHFLWEMVTSSLRRLPIIGKVFKRGQSHPILCSGCRWGSLMKEFKNATDISFPRGSDNLGAHDFTTENVARLSVLPSVPGLLSR